MFCPIWLCCTHHTLSETQQLCCWAVGRKRRPVRGYRVTPRVTVVAQEHSVCVLTDDAGGHKGSSVALRSRCLRWIQTNLRCQYFTLLNHRYACQDSYFGGCQSRGAAWGHPWWAEGSRCWCPLSLPVPPCCCSWVCSPPAVVTVNSRSGRHCPPQ